MNSGDSESKVLEGISVFPGTVYGEFFVPEEIQPSALPFRNITQKQAEAEGNRFQGAIELAKNEIAFLQEGGGEVQREILGAQLLMLSDPEFIPLVKSTIETRLINAEAALRSCIDSSVEALRSSGSDFLAARAADIEDAFGRVMQKLLLSDKPRGASGGSFSAENLKGKILAAFNIAPSEAVSLKNSGIAAIIMEEGGPACHVAVLAKSWEIPAVLGVSGLMKALSSLPEGSRILVDGASGKIVTGLSEKEAEKYARAVPVANRQSRSKEQERLKCETADGEGFSILANIAMPDECADAFAMEGISGVGLFRTEFLFLQSGDFLLADEEMQFKAYKTAAEACGGRVLTIRTMDIGGDKALLSQTALREKNPLLGWRALRYCLSEREVFKTQLKAILRASVFGNVRVMFPMVTSLAELDEALSILEEAKESCRREGLPFDESIKAGAMIEVPSAAVCADLIAGRVSFMSIGTNDLIQYTTAADRENPKVAYLYDSFEPAVLRLIKHVIQCGEKSDVEVSVCGEMAGEPLSACLLFGLGLRKFSMAATSVAAVSKALSAFASPLLTDSAKKALECSTGKEALSIFKSALNIRA